ncbi:MULTISPECIES: carbohydrate kinase family protein [unclassified Leeuwenhoekiella]|uniref:carbohydrate kinase family protein n=1 Tax=unclassified Leeuwenhoekiella TaxID=2615029 RepID=UPI000C11A67F|nr:MULTISPECIES: carbohydrate kinase family protein [unclassified Leeuwenhoekiella]MAS71530.1 carbohydrate kinase family protein [Zunongwangia sp.]MAW96269.1 carbohydrate kinase family protein [Leeuwenhoekiella sp.]MBA82760.1 carbohydrate kinase family protein [Leeuwenhoekiella sp.]PHR95489.1 MAG: carbohydrate kinase family protein [Leeuwenhoekiella sp.]|tara:strand:+ start:17057 stop:18025 length:969 start_codon:yes stop_codon:yes gene_type:complete
MKQPKKILVIGELNVDILLNGIDGFPQMGKEILADSMNVVLGSSSAIFAANAAALGASVSFCGKVGNDAYGELCVRTLKNMGVQTDWISISAEKNTGATLILNYDQDRANITYCGAMVDFTQTDIPWDHIADFDHVHLSNFFVQEGIRKDILEIFKKLKEYGITTSLDTQWDVLERWDFDYKSCLPYVDFFLPNESELLALTGFDSIEKAITEIQDFTNYLALKMGNEGSWGIYNKEILKTDAFSPETFVDAIGAGDSYNAGFVTHFLNTQNFKESLINGNLMGAVNTTATGGTQAFSSQKSLHQILNKLKTARKNEQYEID